MDLFGDYSGLEELTEEQRELFRKVRGNASFFATIPPEKQFYELALLAVSSKVDLHALVREDLKTEQFYLDLISNNPYTSSNPYLIKLADNQTDRMKLAAVKGSGHALEYVKEPTYEVCLEAVRENGYALQYVEEQTEEICLEAVKTKWDFLEDYPVLKHVKEQTEQICLESVRTDGRTLAFVKNQTMDLCVTAVENHCYAIEHVNRKFLTEELCYLAFEKGYSRLEIIPEQLRS